MNLNESFEGSEKIVLIGPTNSGKKTLHRALFSGGIKEKGDGFVNINFDGHQRLANYDNKSKILGKITVDILTCNGEEGWLDTTTNRCAALFTKPVCFVYVFDYEKNRLDDRKKAFKVFQKVLNCINVHNRYSKVFTFLHKVDKAATVLDLDIKEDFKKRAKEAFQEFWSLTSVSLSSDQTQVSDDSEPLEFFHSFDVKRSFYFSSKRRYSYNSIYIGWSKILGHSIDTEVKETIRTYLYKVSRYLRADYGLIFERGAYLQVMKVKVNTTTWELKEEEEEEDLTATDYNSKAVGISGMLKELRSVYRMQGMDYVGNLYMEDQSTIKIVTELSPQLMICLCYFPRFGLVDGRKQFHFNVEGRLMENILKEKFIKEFREMDIEL